MIEMRKLRDLVKLMKDNDLIELDLRDETQTVTLRRPGPQAPVPHPVVQQPAPPPAAAPAESAGGTSGSPSGAGAGDAAASEGPPPGTVEITSPMVGTFYNSPSPDADPFVRNGTKVESETVVCIIEAMKVFNEIKAEVTGTVEKVLVENGQAVEFGQPLFLVRSA